ncbi:hypothetical protein [Parasitella parasitica]|uniref:DNA helicase Pif1-like 2B domain-containing protein n=1 Tax=Parasitella parasitica TaxID=35722 RepID=A0A0B7NSX2_9FUNG|nr:hypothetical protein [Parasitella parasitica]
MRVQRALQSNGPVLAEELRRFSEFLLNVGQGNVPTITLPGGMPTDFIRIPDEILLPGDNLINLLTNVYFDILRNGNDPNYFASRAILTAKNVDVKAINDLLLGYIPGHKFTYKSNDLPLMDENQAMEVPVRVLNLIENGSLPPHELHLKIGSPIMVIRNIDPAAGVCN